MSGLVDIKTTILFQTGNTCTGRALFVALRIHRRLISHPDEEEEEEAKVCVAPIGLSQKPPAIELSKQRQAPLVG